MTQRRTLGFRPRFTTALLAALTLLACEGGPEGAGDSPGDGFVSDDPGASTGDYNGGGAASGGGATGAGGSGGGGGSGGSAGGEPGVPGDGGDPERLLAEADIVQLVGDRLYALSRYGGLSIIDAAQPERLRLLGRLKLEATPFEMYVRDGVVLALYSDWGQYSADGVWRTTSQVVAIDATDPARPSIRGQYRMPGEVSDSRIVGDVLYVVTYENGSCWECDTSGSRTVVASLDVRDPAAMRQVDVLAYSDAQDQWGWHRRSISVNAQRMYVAGPEYGVDGSGSSTIQVVDISDPAGDLVPGATVEAAGVISSRWQMDEHEGVLRVISQPSSWNLDEVPTVQTFSVTSSQRVTALGRTPLVLPRPEQLQSVRFDGPRGYAITFERTDPLFTIDLSDPAQPRQVGMLEMPGWVYHMEPRGDRVVALGYDQGNVDGGLNVSLFDVSDLAAPTMIDRVSFGGDWGYLPEDQDRIHKAFKVLDSEGLVLVPFSGYTYDAGGSGCGSYRSGVQLVDFARDDLGLRGVADSRGEARRALLHRERLLTVSDDAVQVFDIADRGAPAKVGGLPLAVNVRATASAGDTTVRLGTDWWSNTATLDVVPTSAADSPAPTGSLDLESILREDVDQCYGGGFSSARVFSHGQQAYVVYEDYSWDQYGYTSRVDSAVAVIDVADPAAPRLVSNTPLGFSASTGYGWYGYGYGSWGLVDGGAGVVQAGSTLAFRGAATTWNAEGTEATTDAWLTIVDLSDPAAPTVQRLEEPARGEGFTNLHVSGTTVLSGHHEPVAGSEGQVRFYLDRVDVSDPSAPRRLPSVNVPGSLLAWDAATSRAVLVDYHHVIERNLTWDQCYVQHGYQARWEANDPHYYERPEYYEQGILPLGTCFTLRHTLELVRVGATTAVHEGTAEVPERVRITGAAQGDGRVFVAGDDGYGYYGSGDCFDCGGYASDRRMPLMVLSGFAQGDLVATTMALPIGDYYGYTHLVAAGQRALLATGWRGELVVVDAADAAAPRVAQRVPVVGYPESIEVVGSTALVSLGYDGVQAVQLTE